MKHISLILEEYKADNPQIFSHDKPKLSEYEKGFIDGYIANTEFKKQNKFLKNILRNILASEGGCYAGL